MSREVDVKALISHIVRGDGSDKCRICMGDTSEGQVFLGDTVMMDGERSVTLAELLEVITGVEVELSSPLPRMVCSPCVASAMVSAPFIQMCRAADEKWREFSDCLANFSENVSSNSKSACIFIQNKEQTTLESTTRANTSSEALQLVKKYLRHSTGRKRIAKAYTDLKCPECLKTYPTINLLNVHLKKINKIVCYYCKQIVDFDVFPNHIKRHGRIVFTCKVCKKFFKVEFNYLKHLRLCKKKKGSHVCVECSQSFISETKMVTHYAAIHNPRVCSVCNKKFISKVCFRNHLQICGESKAGGSKFICDHCSKAYNCKSGLRLHIQLKHLMEYIYQCERCGKKFSNPYHLREHDNTHNRVEDRFVCTICSTKYSTRRGYQRHYKKHFDKNGLPTDYKFRKKINRKPELMECFTCDYKTDDKTAFREHLRRMHNNQRHSKKHFDKNDLPTDNKIRKKINRTSESMECFTCDYKTDDKTAFREHLRRMHNILSVKVIIPSNTL